MLAATPAQSAVSVYDAWAQRTRNVQLARLIDHLANAKAMRTLALDQLEALTGSRGYGALLFEGLMASLPKGDGEVEAVMEGGPGGGRAGALARSLNQSRQLVEANAGEGAEYHETVTRAGNGVRALARVAYQDIVRDLDTVRRLATSIDGARDPKAALDLQARLTAQNAKSVLTTARIMALAEMARAKRQLEDADRAERLRRIMEPSFINPSLTR